MGDERTGQQAAYHCAVPFCESTFGDSYALAEHLKLHAGEKRHVCPVRSCGRRFSTPGNLSRHKRLHGPIKPLECPVEHCICTFRSENKLAKHMRFHLGSAVHVCPAPACGKTFSTAGNLNRHIKGHHPKCDVRAAKALLASQSDRMRIFPPASVRSSPASGSDADMSPSSASSPSSVFPAPVTLASASEPFVDAFAGAEAEKKPLGEMLDPVQLDMLMSLLDVEAPFVGDFGEPDPRLGTGQGWGRAVVPTPTQVLPASHGMLVDALSASSPFPTYSL